MFIIPNVMVAKLAEDHSLYYIAHYEMKQVEKGALVIFDLVPKPGNEDHFKPYSRCAFFKFVEHDDEAGDELVKVWDYILA